MAADCCKQREQTGSESLLQVLESTCDRTDSVDVVRERGGRERKRAEGVYRADTNYTNCFKTKCYGSRDLARACGPSRWQGWVL